MTILKQLVFIFCLLKLPIATEGQKKYALLVGINDYYEVTGIKSKESLNGAVNDARAIKDLLEKKFGFNPANVDTIFNATATRDNIIEGLKKKLKQCKPGDMMVFYYSGHGVYMKNSEEEKDPIKRGMNQAMLTSDLYNYRDHFKCFLRDFTLKTYFNYFVDKKVLLTSIFDCCFSANLAMADQDAAATTERTKSVDFNELMSRLTDNIEDPQVIIDSISEISRTTPSGCKTDASGAITDTADSDGDGVPDCKDKEKFTDKACMPVNADGVGKCEFNFLLQKTLNKFDAGELDNNNTAFTAAAERSFNPTEVLQISEKDTIARPSERKNSRFLFIAATKDWQKALEFKDENQQIHGLFTASLLRVFNQYPASTPVADLFEKLKLDMAKSKKEQDPTLFSDPARLKSDLIGNSLTKVNR